jgi:hypothetical protein
MHGRQNRGMVADESSPSSMPADLRLRRKLFGPMPPPPRVVIVRRKTKLIVAGVVGFLVVMVLVAALVHESDRRHWTALRDHGVLIDAKITKIAPSSSGKTSGFRVAYTFTPAISGASAFTGERFFRKDDLGSRRVGDALTVTYLPSNLASNEPYQVTADFAASRILPSLLATIFLAVTLLPVAGFLMRRQWTRVQRMRLGRFTLAEITGLSPRQRGVILSVAIPHGSGAPQAQSLHILAPECVHLRVGQRIGWIVDPSERSGEPLFLAATAYDWVEADVGDRENR